MNRQNGGIQLPDDVIAQGYRETRPFHHEQVFYSRQHDFTGTEREFVAAGFGYEYYESDYRRFITSRQPPRA